MAKQCDYYTYNEHRYPERDNSTLKPDKKPRYYYHLTDKENWEDRMVLSPIEGKGGNRSSDEPSNARICVSHAIANCMAALPYCGEQTYFVYRTEKKGIAYWPYGVEDSVVTRERWLISPTAFIFVATLNTGPFIDKAIVPSVNDGTGVITYLVEQRKLRDKWIAALKSPPIGGFELEKAWFDFEK